MLCREVVVAIELAVLLAAGATAGLKEDLAGTQLLYSYVVFRHGDRTPDLTELATYPKGPSADNSYHPWGYAQLTNTGKSRAYFLGKYLRSHYESFLDHDYLPGQILVNCTNADRTKMTALSALAAIYPPTLLQRWNAELPWQPIPYSVQNVPSDACSSHYYQLFSRISMSAEVQTKLAAYSDLFDVLTEHTGGSITSPIVVLLLQGGIQGNLNYGIDPPAWYEELLPEIEEVVGLSFQLMFYNDELIRTYAGPLLDKFLVTAAESVVAGTKASPFINILSAHDSTMAGVMSAARVFDPHRPQYGAAFSLELRRNLTDGVYYVAPVYKVGGEAGERAGAARVLRVAGCGERALCPLDTFVQLTKSVVLAPSDVDSFCGSA